ncbi:MAG: ketopantoate reductase family protein [Anaerolineae bacterium]
MKILVYGAGAIGGYLGAKLALAGHDLTIIDMEVTAGLINDDGLHITEGGQTAVVHPTAYPSVAALFMGDPPTFDLILMGMKSYHLAEAVNPLAAFNANPPHIMTIQNGIDVEQPLVEQFGAECLIAGSFTTPISKESSNRLVVEHSGRGLALASPAGQDVRQWVNLFNQAGVKTIRAKNYEAMKWSKALLNIVGNATAAILNRRPGVIYKSAAMFDVELRMLQEMLAVMKKKGIPVMDLPGSPAKKLATAVTRVPKALLKPILTKQVVGGRGDKMPSFQIDLVNGAGNSEVQFHNGAIARHGAAVGVLTPVNAVLNEVLMKLTRQELDWREFDGRPNKLLAEIGQYEKNALSR